MNLAEIYLDNYNVFFINSFGRVYDTTLNAYSDLKLSNTQKMILRDNSSLRLLIANRQRGKTSVMLFDLIATASKSICDSIVYCNNQAYVTMLTAWTRDMMQDFGNIPCTQTKYNTIVLSNGSTIVFNNIDNFPHTMIRQYDNVYIDEVFLPKENKILAIVEHYASSGTKMLVVGTSNDFNKIRIFDDFGFSIHHTLIEEESIKYPSELRNVVLDMYEF